MNLELHGPITGRVHRIMIFIMIERLLPLLSPI